MPFLLAAAAVTLVVTTAEDKVDARDGKLSLREAIAEANDSPKPVVITFAKAALGYHSMLSALDIHPRAPLVIRGDADDDGQSDVILLNGYAEKAIIGPGSDVTIIGVDFLGGSSAGAPGANGVVGADGMQGLAGVNGSNNGTPVKPTDGGPGGAGKPGSNGRAGENSAGVIRNFGKLTLVRLGLGQGYSLAGYGGYGGGGGWGGFGGSGGKGVGASPSDVAIDHPVVQNGANGAPAGSGAAGGAGGKGGHSGGSILNESTGELTLTDVAFGGRLGSFLIGRGSMAIAGRGGQRGTGGDGRRGGLGGAGGGALYVTSVSATFVWRPRPGTEVTEYWIRYTPTAAGAGGSGANGGDRGPDGVIGAGGSAASALLNLGAVKGDAALGAPGKATPAPATTNGSTAFVNGGGGSGGSYGAGRISAFSFCPGIAARGDPSFTAEAMKHAPGDYRLDFPPNNGVTPPTRSGPAGLPGADNTRQNSGTAGVGKDGVLNVESGVGAIDVAGSLVFVHPLGVQKGKKGKDDTLDFNIVRIGKGDGSVKVKWSIKPAKKGASVDPRVFSERKLPSGTASFGKIAADATTDVENSVKRVSLPIERKRVDGKSAGYQIEIKLGKGEDVILGTSAATGVIERE